MSDKNTNIARDMLYRGNRQEQLGVMSGVLKGRGNVRANFNNRDIMNCQCTTSYHNTQKPSDQDRMNARRMVEASAEQSDEEE